MGNHPIKSDYTAPRLSWIVSISDVCDMHHEYSWCVQSKQNLKARAGTGGRKSPRNAYWSQKRPSENL